MKRTTQPEEKHSRRIRIFFGLLFLFQIAIAFAGYTANHGGISVGAQSVWMSQRNVYMNVSGGPDCTLSSGYSCAWRQARVGYADNAVNINNYVIFWFFGTLCYLFALVCIILMEMCVTPITSYKKPKKEGVCEHVFFLGRSAEGVHNTLYLFAIESSCQALAGSFTFYLVGMTESYASFYAALGVVVGNYYAHLAANERVYDEKNRRYFMAQLVKDGIFKFFVWMMLNYPLITAFYRGYSLPWIVSALVVTFVVWTTLSFRIPHTMMHTCAVDMPSYEKMRETMHRRLDWFVMLNWLQFMTFNTIIAIMVSQYFLTGPNSSGGYPSYQLTPSSYP